MINDFIENINSNFGMKMTEHTTNNNSEAEKATNNTPKNNVDKQTNNYPSDIQGLFDRLGI